MRFKHYASDGQAEVGCQPEKRKVGGSTPPLTTTPLSI